jgi:hypothetical protein
VIAGIGVGAVFRASLATVISISNPDDRAGAVATVYTAGYGGVSVPVIGVALVLEHMSPRVTLLIFGIATAVGIMAAAPVLVRANLVKPKGSAPAGGSAL